MGLHSANERRQCWRQGPKICRQMMCPERQKAFKVLTHGSPYFAALSLELVSAPVEEWGFSCLACQVECVRVCEVGGFGPCFRNYVDESKVEIAKVARMFECVWGRWEKTLLQGNGTTWFRRQLGCVWGLRRKCITWDLLVVVKQNKWCEMDRMQWNLNDSIFTEVMVQYDEKLCNVNISSVQTIESNEWHAAILFLGQKLARADEEGEHVWESLHDLELSSISLQSLNSFRLPCYALSFGTVCVSAFADFSTCRVPEPRRYCKIRTLG